MTLVTEHGRRRFSSQQCEGDRESERYAFEVALIDNGWHTFAIGEDDGGMTICWGLPDTRTSA